jgi:C-terminal processing protease CtpA/Prc
VVYVGPNSAAFKAGLQPGDVIEAINGEAVVSRPVPATLLSGEGSESIFNVVRNRQKLVIKIKMK